MGCIPIPWKAVSGGPFLYDVSKDLLGRLEEKGGGTDLLTPDDYASFNITEDGISIENENETFTCEKMFINRYGELFVEKGTLKDGDCFQRAINILEYATLKAKTEADKQALEANLTYLRTLSLDNGAMCTNDFDFFSMLLNTVIDGTASKNDTFSLCAINADIYGCRYYLSPSGAISYISDVLENGRRIFSKSKFEAVYNAVENALEKNPNNSQLTKLKSLLDSAKTTKGVLPPD